MGRLIRLAILAPLALASACKPGVTTYPQSVDAAQAALVGTKIPGLAFGYAVHTGAGVATGDGVAWYVQQGPDNDPDGPHFAPTPDIMRLTATLKPADNAVAGDYMVTVSAQPLDSKSSSSDFRITVTTSTLWGVVGIGLIAIAVVAVGMAVARFGRR